MRRSRQFVSRSPEVSKQIRAAASAALRDALAQIETRAAERAPVDTGSLRASIYVDIQGLASASWSADRRKPTGQAGFGAYPQVQTSDLKGFAAVGVEYGIFVHEGHLAVRPGGSTRNRKTGLAAMRVGDRQAGTWVPARPFLKQAGDEISARFLPVILPHYLAKHGL